MREVDLLLFLIEFVHREVNDPAEMEIVVGRGFEIELIADANPGGAREFCRGVGLAGREEDSISGLCARCLGDALLDWFGDELGNRTFADKFSTIIFEDDVTQSGRFHFGSRPVVELVEERARLAPRTWGGDRAYDTALSNDGLESFELNAGVGKLGADVSDDNGITQIGFVGTVFQHRLGIRNAHKGQGAAFPAIGELLEDAVQHRFDGGENVFLGDKAHLQVELVELARRAVGARVFIAKAGRDLEITVEARHHDQLLELLRGLRQGVELAGVQT